MGGGTTPNKKIPFLPAIPISKDDWHRLRNFLMEVKHKIESQSQNPDAPDQVRNLVATVVSGGIVLTWNPSNRATGYVVYRAAESIDFDDAAEIGYLARADRLSFFDPAGQFPIGTKLTYWVVAKNGLE